MLKIITDKATAQKAIAKVQEALANKGKQQPNEEKTADASIVEE